NFIGANVDLFGGGLIGVVVMYCDCVDTLIRVLGAISGRAVEAGILHQAIGAVRQDFPFDVNSEIPGLGKIQPKSILGHGAVCQFTASDNVKRVDHAVAIARRKTEEKAIMTDSEVRKTSST